MKSSRLLLLVMLIAAFAACNSNEKKADIATGDSSLPMNPTMVQQDSTILSDDSATLKTAVGVKDEEQNAKKQILKESEKLKKDEKK
ncbi:MAG: hypothetical protein JSS80_08035 [Bacteroidetes bacterium]|nr:hypothetical protein [Bacteroidota bacterium]